MNAPDPIVSKWYPRAGSLAERVLAWLPLQPGGRATAVQIAEAHGVTRPANVHVQLSSAVVAGVLARIMDSEPHVYTLGTALPAPQPALGAHQARPPRPRAPRPQLAPAFSGPAPCHFEQLPWVKCSEGMPGAGQKVLAYSKDRKLERVTQALFFPATADGPAAWREVTFAELSGVTHWTPMPGGPKR